MKQEVVPLETRSLEACTLASVGFRHSTDRRPASIARIVQRRAASQNACRCPAEQNFCADPPVPRGVNGWPHQMQLACSLIRLPHARLNLNQNHKTAAGHTKQACPVRHSGRVAKIYKSIPNQKETSWLLCCRPHPDAPSCLRKHNYLSSKGVMHTKIYVRVRRQAWL